MASGGTLLVLPALASVPPATNYATIGYRNAQPRLQFDAATQEGALWSGLVMPTPNYTDATGLTVLIWWTAATATSGKVVWGVSLERQDTGTDQDADSFATEQTNGTGTTTSATSGAPVSTSIAISKGANMDSVVAGDVFRLRLQRLAADSNDTMAGDAEITAIEIRET